MFKSNRREVCEHCRQTPVVFPGLISVTGEYCGHVKTAFICNKCNREKSIAEILARMFQLSVDEVTGLSVEEVTVYRISRPVVRKAVTS